MTCTVLAWETQDKPRRSLPNPAAEALEKIAHRSAGNTSPSLLQRSPKRRSCLQSRAEIATTGKRHGQGRGARCRRHRPPPGLRAPAFLGMAGERQGRSLQVAKLPKS